jgi:transposase
VRSLPNQQRSVVPAFSSQHSEWKHGYHASYSLILNEIGLSSPDLKVFADVGPGQLSVRNGEAGSPFLYQFHLKPARQLSILLRSPNLSIIPCAAFFNRSMVMEVIAHHSLEYMQQLQRAEKDATRARKLQIVVLAAQGWTAPAIAMAVGLSRRVVQSHVAAFNELGLKAIDERRGARPKPVLNEEQQTQFVERMEQGPQPEDGVCSLRGRDFQRILDEEFGQWRCLTSVYNLLHKLGYSYLRPRPRHQLTDAAKQTAFMQSLPAKIAAIAAQHPDKKLRIFFQDEARFGQQGTTTNVWAKRGSRPVAVRQTAYQYVWVFAAVCPETGTSEGLIAPRLNTDSVNAFLQQFSVRIASDEHAIMLWDGAGFHRSGKLQMPANISPIQLPAYSPELNPIENLWHYLKSHHWSNRAYTNHEELEFAVMDAWHRSVLDTELMKTVCSANVYQSAGFR